MLFEQLKSLNPTDATLWTADGLPKLDAVAQLVGKPVTREEVNAIAFGLTKSNVLTFKQPSAAVAPSIAVAELVITDDELLIDITKLADEVLALQLVITNATKEIDDKNNIIADLRKQLAKEDDPTKLSVGIQSFFAAGDADRRAQEARELAFAKSGFTISDILGSASAIDKRKQP